MFIFSFLFLLIAPVYMVTMYQNYIKTTPLFDFDYTPALLSEPEVILLYPEEEEVPASPASSVS